MTTPATTPETQPLTRWKRYARIYWALFKNSVVREMGFKANFILWIFVELLWFSLQLAFFSVIYQHTSHIGDWTEWEVVLLVGASHFIQQVFQAFFLTNCVEVSELIQTGKLDFMMLLPVNTRFILSLRKVDLGGFVNASTAVGVMMFALHRLDYTPTSAQVAGFLGLCGVGITIHYSLMFLLATISFWTVRAQGIVWGYYSLFNLARMPDSAYRGFFKLFFTFVVPMVLVTNVPVKLLAGRLTDPATSLILIGVGIGCAVISELAWRYSLRRYTSASS